MKNKIILFAVTRFYSIKLMQDMLHSKSLDESNSIFENFKMWNSCYQILCELLGFEFSLEEMLPYKLSDTDIEFFTFIINNCLHKDSLSEKINEYYGREFQISFIFIQMILVSINFSSLGDYMLEDIHIDFKNEIKNGFELTVV